MNKVVYTDVRCSRCKNFIWEGGGFYFRPRDGMTGKPWMVFCREDCARLHVGKTAVLLTRDQYVTKLVDDAIRKKPK